MNDTIKDKVNYLIKKHKTNDPFKIVEGYKSINVIKYPLHESVRGLYQYYKRNSIIYINSNLPEYEQRVVCAHELGHAFLHPKLNILFLERYTFASKNKYEKQANIFAAELLLPDDLFMTYREYCYEEISIIEGLPMELVRLKHELFEH